MIGGAVLASQLIGPVLSGAFSLLWLGIKVAVVSGIIYTGWQWLDRPGR